MDECRAWADKAAALASYARQAADKSLETMAIRIRARAIRRMGELLQAEKAQGKRTDKLLPGGGEKSLEKAAKEAGLSKRRRDTAIQVANVPGDEFEAAVESDTPPKVTDLARRGTKPRPLTDGEIEIKICEHRTQADGHLGHALELDAYMRVRCSGGHNPPSDGGNDDLGPTLTT